jgi:hypothetical protein
MTGPGAPVVPALPGTVLALKEWAAAVHALLESTRGERADLLAVGGADAADGSVSVRALHDVAARVRAAVG